MFAKKWKKWKINAGRKHDAKNKERYYKKNKEKN
jgi:hypothetical protein